MTTGYHPDDISARLACSTSEGDLLVWELLVNLPGAVPAGGGGGAKAAMAAAAASGSLEVITPMMLCVTGGHAQR